MSQYTDEERERAQARFVWMQVLRLAALPLVLVGIAIAQGAIAAPYWLGVGLALAGIAAFFFGPPLLARKFKARDTKLPDRAEKP